MHPARCRTPGTPEYGHSEPVRRMLRCRVLGVPGALTVLGALGATGYSTGTRIGAPVLTRSTKIVPLSFEPGSSATSPRSTPSHGVVRPLWPAAHTGGRTHARTHKTHAPRLFTRGGGSHLRATCWCCGGTRRGAVGVLEGAPYYKHGTGPAARAGAWPPTPRSQPTVLPQYSGE